MKFIISVPSLERAALTSISAALWNSPHIRSFIVELLASDELPWCFTLNETWGWEGWSKVSKKVLENVQKLIIPEKLAEKLSSCTDAMGVEIFRWILFHIQQLMVESIPAKFVWTTYGTIELQKTAKLLMSDDAIPIDDRFILACNYCLEEHIFALWDQLDRDTVRSMKNIVEQAQERRVSMGLMRYWFDCIPSVLDEPTQHEGYREKCHRIACYRRRLILKSRPAEGFKRSLLASNCVAAKYFYSKCSETEKNESIAPILTEEYRRLVNTRFDFNLQRAETLCFVLNTMNEDQQAEVLKESLSDLLSLLLEWPWHECYAKIYQPICGAYGWLETFCLMESVIKKKSLFLEDHNYAQIFVHVWQLTPIDYRRRIIYELLKNDSKRRFCEFSVWIPCLIKHGNWYACSLFLKDAYEGQRRQLLATSGVRNVFAAFIAAGNWDRIERFVAKCHLSNPEIITFRDELKKMCNSPESAEKFKIFNRFVDAFITGNRKRCIENTGSEQKRARIVKIL